MMKLTQQQLSSLHFETAVMEPEKHHSCPSIHFSRRLRPECLWV